MGGPRYRDRKASFAADWRSHNVEIGNLIDKLGHHSPLTGYYEQIVKRLNRDRLRVPYEFAQPCISTSPNLRVKQDDFKKVTSFIGPNCALDQTADTLVIRAWKLRDGNVEYQIYVADEYVYEVIRGGSGWRLYSLGHDSDGNSLDATVISRNVNW